MKLTQTLALFFLSLNLFAQKPDPVHFSYDLKKTADKKFELVITAVMDEGWHIFSQTQPPEAISVPTQIKFGKNPLLTTTGKPKEVGTKEKYEDKAAGIVQYQYGNKVEFIQDITVRAIAKTSITGTITYQSCTSEMCLPLKTVSFSVPIN